MRENTKKEKNHKLQTGLQDLGFITQGLDYGLPDFAFELELAKSYELRAMS